MIPSRVTPIANFGEVVGVWGNRVDSSRANSITSKI